MPSAPLPPLSPTDTTLLLRLLALSENYQALANELMAAQAAASSPSVPSCLRASVPVLDILDLYAWADQPHIAAWLSRHREMTDLQLRTIALDTLEKIAKTPDNKLEQRRAASTILRALDHRLGWLARSRERPTGPPSPRDQRVAESPWRREVVAAATGEGRARVRTDSRSYAAPPPPRSHPQPSPDPAPALAAIREALSTPQVAVALSTIHEHSAPNASFAAHPIHADKADWIAELPKHLPAGFRFPLTYLTGPKELERTGGIGGGTGGGTGVPPVPGASPEPATTPIKIRYELWLLNLQRDRFRCNLTLIRDGPDHPNPCWRLAALDILQHNTG